MILNNLNNIALVRIYRNTNKKIVAHTTYTQTVSNMSKNTIKPLRIAIRHYGAYLLATTVSTFVFFEIELILEL